MTDALNKESCKHALINGYSIEIEHLHIYRSDNNNYIYISCNIEGCNSCEDSFRSFEEFWKYWGKSVLEYGILRKY